MVFNTHTHTHDADARGIAVYDEYTVVVARRSSTECNETY
jgi:hypothetical protein